MSRSISTAPYTKPHGCLIRLRLYLPPVPLPVAHSHTLTFLYLGFKPQLLLLGLFFLNLQAGILTKFEIQSVSCSAKLIDVLLLRGNIPLLCREACAAFDNSHLLYSGVEEKEKTKEIKLFNSRPKVSQPEVKLISLVQLFPEYGFMF